MKKVFFTFIFLSAIVLAQGLIAIPDSSDKTSIELKSETTGEIVVKSYFQPIQAWEYDNSVEVEFLTNLGIATLKVKNGQGQVMYQITVNTAAHPVIAINTAGWSAGSYTLEITAGTSAWSGMFEL